jgi:hypothetical protein
MEQALTNTSFLTLNVNSSQVLTLSPEPSRLSPEKKTPTLLRRQHQSAQRHAVITYSTCEPYIGPYIRYVRLALQVLPFPTSLAATCRARGSSRSLLLSCAVMFLEISPLPSPQLRRYAK